MTDPKETNQYGDLEQMLRDEAAADRPEFSNVLHERIIESVDTFSATVGWPPQLPARRHVRRWAYAATAALLLLAVGAALWNIHATNVGRQPASANQLADVPLITIDAVSRANGAEMGMLVDSTLSRNQWAYLDHDARVAAELLIEQLPFELAKAD